jgi:hypothetical protein
LLVNSHSANFDLAMLHGATLHQIAISEDEVLLFFRPDGCVGVRGPWTLADPAGKLVDRSMPNAEREALRLHPLLGSTVVGSEAAAPQSFMLRFDNGYVFAASKYSRANRSFSIHPDFEPKPGGA